MASSASPFLVFVLTFFVLVGHLCELPTVDALAEHVHEGAHHSSDRHPDDHHADESRISCDPVVAVQPNTSAYPDRGPDIGAGPGPLWGQTAVRVVAAPLHESHAVLRRPPLFLLHASLLI